MTDLIARGMLRAALAIESGGPGSGPQGGGGGGSGGSKSSGKSSASKSTAAHSVKLPSNPAKMSISQADKALQQMGMKLGAGKSSIVGGKFVTSYTVTMADGTSRSMGTDEMKSLIYSGASK